MLLTGYPVGLQSMRRERLVRRWRRSNGQVRARTPDFVHGDRQ